MDHLKSKETGKGMRILQHGLFVLVLLFCFIECF
jgi:hypothetical protein